MIKHYFTIAFRNLMRQKGLAFINVFGLSVGLACFMVFLLFAINEFSFDRFHEKNKNIYRVYRSVAAMNGEQPQDDPYLPSPIGPALKQDFPDVKDVTRLRGSWGDNTIRVNGAVRRSELSFADPSFFSIFSFSIIEGNRTNPLGGLNDIVLTRSKAKELFGTEHAVGQVMDIEFDKTYHPFKVTAVTDDMPPNSSMRFDVLASFAFWEATANGKRGVNNWNRSAYNVFVELRDGSTLAADAKKMGAFRSKYYPNDVEQLKKDGIKWTGSGLPVTYGMQPLRDIHTNPNMPGMSVPSIDPKNIWVLLSIAAGVLLIACINFTTLSIGRSAGRAKEIGVRKVIGSDRRQIAFQFLSEALILTIFSSVIGLGLGRLFLPLFNQLSDRELSFSFTQYPEITWMFTGLVLLVAVLAGAYPALLLSRFKAIEVLKNKVRVGGSNFFTKALVTLQFAVSIGLIISTVIILQQISFMKDKDPGFNKSNVVMIDAGGTNVEKTFPILKEGLLKQASIKAVAGAEIGLGAGTGFSRSGFEFEGKHKEVYEYFVDNDYFGLMDIKLLAGRNFDPKLASDTINSVIINEAMMQDFGWTLNNAIGKEIKGYSERLTPVVIGVFKNIHYRPFSAKVDPQMFHQFNDYAPYKLMVRIQPGQVHAGMAAIQKEWKQVEPVLPLKYDFLDESLNNFYKAEQRWSSIIGWAGGICIFLACMGLFGLAALAAINRTKEIGIRKVLGASVASITGLISKDFLKLVIISLLVASPIAWFLMNKWLQDFAYRIDISWLVFAISGIIACMVAFVTVGMQAVKAALRNPVNSLRSE